MNVYHTSVSMHANPNTLPRRRPLIAWNLGSEDSLQKGIAHSLGSLGLLLVLLRFQALLLDCGYMKLISWYVLGLIYV